MFMDSPIPRRDAERNRAPFEWMRVDNAPQKFLTRSGLSHDISAPGNVPSIRDLRLNYRETGDSSVLLDEDRPSLFNEISAIFCE